MYLRAGEFRGREGQHGQAIVLLAVAMTALTGMLALAIDGGRAYVDRRELQNAADSAALAAADNYLYGGDFTVAEAKAASVYALNERIYGTASCTPSWSTPGLGSATSYACTWSGDSGAGHSVTITTTRPATGGAVFTVAATHALGVTFTAVLGTGPTVNIPATATAAAYSSLPIPALLTLSSSCSNSMSVSGSNGSVTVVGDVVSDGGISAANGQVTVAGNVTQVCSGTPNVTLYCFPSDTPPPCTSPNALGTRAGGAGSRVDPALSAPSLAGLPNRSVSNYLLHPGVYNSFSLSTCYFLEAGVYDLTGGVTSSGGFASNELKPPEEPSATDNTADANPQFWNNRNACTGSVALSSTSNLISPVGVLGNLAVEVTSTRTDTFGSTTYKRESAPSKCVNTGGVGAFKSLSLSIGNVPGAEGYNVYLSPGGCAGPFGFLTSVVNPSYGSTSSLGSTSLAIDGTILTSSFAVSASAAPDTPGALPPDSEVAAPGPGLPQSNAAGTWPHGDRANEQYCLDPSAAATSCPGWVVPGAVTFYIPAGACFNISGQADLYTFSGPQYSWVTVYEPGAFSGAPNTCNNSLGGNATSTLIGVFYAPAATLSITGSGSFSAPVDGAVIVQTATVAGNGGFAIATNPRFLPAAPGAHLTG